jgi:RNA polymerase sigma-70 factor (ECF subfamily)
VLLEEQDRGQWDAARIAEGQALIGAALRAGRVGAYQIQAAIAALHDEAPTWAQTDWPQIAGLYRRLLAIDPSPVIELNLAVAVAMADGPAIGLALMDGLAAGGRLDTYPYLHAARADLLRRLDRRSESAAAYRRAIELTDNRAERAFLQARLDALASPDEGPRRLS